MIFPSATFMVSIILLIFELVWFIFTYNKLKRRQILIKEAQTNLDASLVRRYDIVSGLNEVIHGFIGIESDIQKQIATVRNQQNERSGVAMQTQLTGIERFIGGIRGTIEAYPELKSSNNIAQLMNDLVQTEEDVAGTRLIYNKAVSDYRDLRSRVPANLVADLIDAPVPVYFEVNTSTRVS